MNIEIVDFFPAMRDDEKQILLGTMHVRFQAGEFCINIRGINVQKRKDAWYFYMPNRKGIDHVNGKDVFYPVFSFEDREHSRQLLELIKDQGKKFIMDKLLNGTLHQLPEPNVAAPVMQPTKKEISAPVTPQKAQGEPISRTSRPIVTAWQDPPARKLPANRQAKVFFKK